MFWAQTFDFLKVVKYISKILLYVIVIVIMINLIILIKNDYILTIIYLGIIIASITLKKERADLLILVIGFLGTLIGEYLFVSIGVETFNRASFFGIIPLWLPFLWSYIFLAMKRVFWILVKKYF